MTLRRRNEENIDNLNNDRFLFFRGVNEEQKKEIVEYAKKKFPDRYIFHSDFGGYQFVEPYFPFLTILKELFSDKNEKYISDFIENSDVYRLHKRLLINYLSNKDYRREEDVVIDEVEYLKKELSRSILNLIENATSEKKILLIFDNLHLMNRSSAFLLKYLLFDKKKKFNFEGIFFFNKIDLLSEQNKSTKINTLIAKIEKKYQVVNITLDEETNNAKKIETEIDYDRIEKEVLRGKILYDFFAFEDCFEFFSKIINSNNDKFLDIDLVYLEQIYKLYGDVNFYLKNFDSAIIYYEKQLNIIQKNNDLSKISENYRTTGWVYLMKNDVNRANYFINLGLNLANNINDKLQIFRALHIVCLIQRIRAFSNEEIKSNLSKCRILANELGFYNIEPFFYAPQSPTLYSYNENISLCASGVKKANNSKNFYILSKLYHFLGMVYSTNGEIVKSLKYYKKTEVLNRRFGNTLDKAAINNSIGYTYLCIEEYNKSIKHYNRALNYLKNSNYFFKILITLYNIGLAYLMVFNHKKTVAIMRTIKNIMNILNYDHIPYHSIDGVYSILGLAYAHNGNINKALDYNKFLSKEEKFDVNEHDLIFKKLLQGFILSKKNEVEKSREIYEFIYEIFKKNKANISLQNISPRFYFEYLSFLREIHDSNFDKYLKEFINNMEERGFTGNKKFITEYFINSNKIELYPNFKNIVITVKDILIRVKNDNILNQLHKRINEVNFINNFQNVIELSTDKNDLINKAVNFLFKNLPYDIAFHYSTRPNALFAIHNYYSTENNYCIFPIKILSKLNNLNEQVFIKSTKTDLEYSEIFDGILSFYRIPLMDKNSGDFIFIGSINPNMLVTTEDVYLISIVIKHLAITLEKTILHEELKRAYDENKKELLMARKIQQSLIPKSFPLFAALNMRGLYMPMDALGGDLYDVYKISDTKLGVVILDVCGHGIPAALITTMAKISFNNYSKDNLSTSQILENVNRELQDIMGSAGESDYFTAFYCIIDSENKTIQYTNAGHNDIYIVRNKVEILKLKVNSSFVGLMKGIKFISDTVKLNDGDRIILYTDGIVEAKDNENNLYGEKRFINLILENSELTVDRLIDKISDDLNLFTGVKLADDDKALLIADVYLDENL